MTTTLDDPIIVKRRKIASVTSAGKRLGYGLYLVATALLAYGFWQEFSTGIEVGIIVCLVVGSVILAPSIVFSYAVKAADRADRNNDW